MLGQILKRIRLNQETIIYYQRLGHYGTGHREASEDRTVKPKLGDV